MNDQYLVKWTVRLATASGRETDRQHSAGPLTKPAAEKFAIGLAATVGPQLGDVQIVPVTEVER